jgi:hypothetical protein
MRSVFKKIARESAVGKCHFHIFDEIGQIRVPRLTDETRWAKIWMSYKAGLIYHRSVVGCLDFVAGDELLVSFCCRFEDYQIMSNI